MTVKDQITSDNIEGILSKLVNQFLNDTEFFGKIDKKDINGHKPQFFTHFFGFKKQISQEVWIDDIKFISSAISIKDEDTNKETYLDNSFNESYLQVNSFTIVTQIGDDSKLERSIDLIKNYTNFFVRGIEMEEKKAHFLGQNLYQIQEKHNIFTKEVESLTQNQDFHKMILESKQPAQFMLDALAKEINTIAKGLTSQIDIYTHMQNYLNGMKASGLFSFTNLLSINYQFANKK